MSKVIMRSPFLDDTLRGQAVGKSSAIIGSLVVCLARRHALALHNLGKVGADLARVQLRLTFMTSGT